MSEDVKEKVDLESVLVSYYERIIDDREYNYNLYLEIFEFISVNWPNFDFFKVLAKFTKENKKNTDKIILNLRVNLPKGIEMMITNIKVNNSKVTEYRLIKLILEHILSTVNRY